MNGGNGSRVLVRGRQGRLLAGVCVGIADYLSVDVTVVRVIVAVVAFFTGGAGVLAYLVAWALIPDEGKKDSIAEEFVSKNTHASSR
jgi:phage shock protein C